MNELQQFLTHIKRKSPRFKCYATGDRTEKLTFTAPLAHVLNPPASATDIQTLVDVLGKNSGQIREFYSMHDGMQLYCHSEGSALEFPPIRKWPELKAGLKAWHDAFDTAPEDMNPFERYGTAIGEPTFSGNYFVFYEGAVYYFDHDSPAEAPLASSFFEFLARIATDPPLFLYEIGCYTRCKDGKTDTQYIPAKFETD